MNFKTIRAVLFDFDGTLRFNKPDANQFFFDYAVSLGAADTPDNRRAAYQWAHAYWNDDGGVRKDIEILGRSTPEFWLHYTTKYLIAFGCQAAQAAALAPRVQAHMSENYNPVNWVDPNTFRVLDSLRDQGYTLGVVSNRDEPFSEELETLGLGPHFDFSLSAGEAKSWKPKPEIFHTALEITQTKPHETIYVGDNYFADIVGARNAGLHPVLIDPLGVFPDADCLVITHIGELNRLLD